MWERKRKDKGMIVHLYADYRDPDTLKAIRLIGELGLSQLCIAPVETGLELYIRPGHQQKGSSEQYFGLPAIRNFVKRYPDGQHWSQKDQH